MRLNNKQKITSTILIALLFVSLSLFAQKRMIKVACIGNSVTYANKSIRQLLKGFFGVVVGPNVEVGISCSPLAAHTKW